jgi:hypothetical protein
MREIRLPVDLIRELFYSATKLPLNGSPSDKNLWKLQHLDRSLLLIGLQLNVRRHYVINCLCLVFQFDGPVNMYCNNSGVVANASRPESTLEKKHNAIAYHRAHEAVAAGTI